MSSRTNVLMIWGIAMSWDKSEDVLEKKMTESAPLRTSQSSSAGISYGKSLGFGFSAGSHKPKTSVTLPPGCEDYLKLIEASANFSTAYSLSNSPREDILQGKITSVIFKASESQLKQIATYHFWKKSYSTPDYYVITVSTKDRQLDAIEYKEEGSVPTKFFKITDENYVDIVEYSTPRL